jgi:hypothetical protein
MITRSRINIVTDDASQSARKPNPEAIAWYVQQAEALLDDLRERVQSLRTRAGQLAGFAAAVVALVGGNADRILNALDGCPRDIAGIALLAGTLLLVAALVTSILGAPFRPQLVSDISAREIANYTTERFTHEPIFGAFISGRSGVSWSQSIRPPEWATKQPPRCVGLASSFWSASLRWVSRSVSLFSR